MRRSAPFIVLAALVLTGMGLRPGSASAAIDGVKGIDPTARLRGHGHQVVVTGQIQCTAGVCRPCNTARAGRETDGAGAGGGLVR